MSEYLLDDDDFSYSGDGQSSSSGGGKDSPRINYVQGTTTKTTEYHHVYDDNINIKEQEIDTGEVVYTQTNESEQNIKSVNVSENLSVSNDTTILSTASNNGKIDSNIKLKTDYVSISSKKVWLKALEDSFVKNTASAFGRTINTYFNSLARGVGFGLTSHLTDQFLDWFDNRGKKINIIEFTAIFTITKDMFNALSSQGAELGSGHEPIKYYYYDIQDVTFKRCPNSDGAQKDKEGKTIEGWYDIALSRKVSDNDPFVDITPLGEKHPKNKYFTNRTQSSPVPVLPIQINLLDIIKCPFQLQAKGFKAKSILDPSGETTRTFVYDFDYVSVTGYKLNFNSSNELTETINIKGALNRDPYEEFRPVF